MPWLKVVLSGEHRSRTARLHCASSASTHCRTGSRRATDAHVRPPPRVKLALVAPFVQAAVRKALSSTAILLECLRRLRTYRAHRRQKAHDPGAAGTRGRVGRGPLSRQIRACGWVQTPLSEPRGRFAHRRLARHDASGVNFGQAGRRAAYVAVGVRAAGWRPMSSTGSGGCLGSGLWRHSIRRTISGFLTDNHSTVRSQAASTLVGGCFATLRCNQEGTWRSASRRLRALSSWQWSST